MLATRKDALRVMNLTNEMKVASKQIKPFLKKIIVFGNNLEAITLEGESIIVELKNGGWCVKEDSLYFESIEQLFMHKSPLFRKKWHEELIKRLN